MAEKFLYENILEEFGRRTIESTEIPDYLKDNLSPKFELRPLSGRSVCTLLSLSGQ